MDWQTSFFYYHGLESNCFPSRERPPKCPWRSLSQDTSPSRTSYNALHCCRASSMYPALCPFQQYRVLTGNIAPVLCYRADRQRRSHCSPNLPALHIQVEPKQILSHITLGHLGQQLPGKGQKGEARQDAGLTTRPSPALPFSILLLKTPIHIFRTGPARRHGLYAEQRTM